MQKENSPFHLQGYKTNNANQALNYAQLQKLLCINKFAFLSDC